MEPMQRQAGAARPARRKPILRRSQIWPHLAVLLLGVAGVAGFGMLTRGFRTVTSDGARRIDLAAAPRRLPPIRMVDSDGKPFLLSQLPGVAGKDTVLTLGYTNCIAICRSAATGLAYLQHQVRARGLDGGARLMTISFDPAHDTPTVLHAYAAKTGADAALWTYATVAAAADLPRLLDTFGIVVLPDGQGGFVHNGALFKVDGRARLARAFAIDATGEALASLLPD